MIEPETAAPGDPAAAWLGALEARHLADLRPAEVGRALRALSSAYVERRDRLARGAALDGAGKRAAFALFYGPLHFLVVRAVVRALGAGAPPVDLIADLGCGTGVAGAAWALECAPRPRMFGVERHPWAADEARWTCRALGLEADVRCGDLARVRLPARASAVVAAYTANELPEDARAALLREVVAAHARGSRVLIVEPIAKSAVPWWPAWADAVRAAGGREDEWRFPIALPGITGRLGRAAGLDHRELTARSLYLGNH
ncbi:MAG: class I SAM-dependent methyltransferase [Vicinamibacterales bacterium]|nr:class I SAM-dependent methyltransferase [Vicinamibacterales bacterium]